MKIFDNIYSGATLICCVHKAPWRCVIVTQCNNVVSLQTISLLVFVSGAPGRKGPFLVLSPLSVMENWRKELERCSHIPLIQKSLQPPARS